MKLSKAKIRILIIIILIIILPCIYYNNLEVYKEIEDGFISNGGVIYRFNADFTERFQNKELNFEKVVGRIDGYNIFETFTLGQRIVKLKECNSQDIFLLNGLMLQMVYTKIE